MSLVTLVAWFGPAVYMQSVGPSVLAVLVVCLVVQLAILGISVVLSKRTLAWPFDDGTTRPGRIRKCTLVPNTTFRKADIPRACG
jgi:hypothetical protein